MLSIVLGAARPAAGASWDDWITAGLTPKFACLLLLSLLAADAGRVWGLDGRRRKGARAEKPPDLLQQRRDGLLESA